MRWKLPTRCARPGAKRSGAFTFAVGYTSSTVANSPSPPSSACVSRPKISKPLSDASKKRGLMPLRVSHLRLGLDDPDSALPDALSRTLGLPPETFRWRILRKSLDTRDKDNIHFVVSLEVHT